jgi:hypothetical protein
MVEAVEYLADHRGEAHGGEGRRQQHSRHDGEGHGHAHVAEQQEWRGGWVTAQRVLDLDELAAPFHYLVDVHVS